MKLTVHRKYKKLGYTIGLLYIDGEFFSNTLEDKDRGLTQFMSLGDIKHKKVYGETAIPTGNYHVTLKVISPKYSNIDWYYKLTKGFMPRVQDVPGFEGILIHPGNNPEQTYGCLLVGRNTVKGGLTESRVTFEKLYKKMKAASDAGEDILLQIY